MHEICTFCARWVSGVAAEIASCSVMTKKHKTKISTLGSRVTSIVSVWLVLIILGLLGVTLQASHSMADDIRSRVGFVVKLMPSATDVDIQRVRRTVDAAPGIAAKEYMSPEAILAEETRHMGEDIQGMLASENPYGAEFNIKVTPEYSVSDSIARLASRFELDPAVEEVVTQMAVVDSVNHVLTRMAWILAGVGAALLVISFVLINNTVSLAIYSRRFIIHTMKLVGATGAFIRRPFVLAGAVTGAVSAAAAIAVLAALRAYAATVDPTVAAMLPWSAMGVIFVLLAVVGTAVCALASVFATNRYLRAKYDDMFKK